MYESVSAAHPLRAVAASNEPLVIYIGVRCESIATYGIHVPIHGLLSMPRQRV